MSPFDAQLLMTWMCGGDTGISSETIAAHMAGAVSARPGHPHDPADLGRCLRLLELFPQWKPRIGEMAKFSPGWAGLVARWDKIAGSMADEVGIDWSKGESAPITYALMQQAIADGYRKDPRYECSFREDGTLRSYMRRR